MNQEESLINNGREFAAHLLSRAVETSTSADNVTGQMVVLQVMATHLLATCTMNAEANAGLNGEQLLERIFTNIRSEYAYLKTELAEGRLQHVKAVVPEREDKSHLH